MCHSVFSPHTTFKRHSHETYLKPLNKMSAPTFFNQKSTLSSHSRPWVSHSQCTQFNHLRLFWWPPCSTSPHRDGVTRWASGWPGGSFRGFQLTGFHHLVVLTQWCVTLKKKAWNKLLFTMRGQKEKVHRCATAGGGLRGWEWRLLEVDATFAQTTVQWVFPTPCLN